MSEFNINLSAGEKKRLLTGGKYCPDDIVVEAVGVDADAIFEAGKQAEYDRFWDAAQENGNRDDYYYMFCGYAWNNDTFKPKYDIKGFRFQSTFSLNGYLKGSLIDMLNVCGVILDTSNANNIGSMFYNCAQLTEIPHIDMSSVNTNVSYIFRGCKKLERIEKVTYTEHSGCYAALAFEGCMALVDVEFAGVIAGDMDLQWSPLLSEATLQSLISHLKDLTGATKKTLKFHADIETKLTDDQKATISALNWTLAFA